MTLRIASLVATPGGPVRKVTLSAMWVTTNRKSLVVCLGKPWAMARTDAEPTVDDFIAQFEMRRLADEDRAARWDGKTFDLFVPMSPQRRVSISRLLNAAHVSLQDAHDGQQDWPIPSESWTPWLVEAPA